MVPWPEKNFPSGIRLPAKQTQHPGIQLLWESWPDLIFVCDQLINTYDHPDRAPCISLKFLMYDGDPKLLNDVC